MTYSVGRLLVWTGVLHQGVGLALGYQTVGQIVRDGYVGAIEVDSTRSTLFWFFVAGFGLMLAGSMLRELESRGGAPARFGYWLLALGIGGGALTARFHFQTASRWEFRSARSRNTIGAAFESVRRSSRTRVAAAT